MVNFIVGKANFDISSGVRTELVKLLESGARSARIIYIVPEQFEYETERAVYRILKQKNLLCKSREVEISTFTAMASEILREGGENRPRADDIVKSVVMHKAVNDCKDMLESLSGIAGRAGFCEKMESTVSGFKLTGLTARGLELSVEKLISEKKLEKNALLLKKLSDASLLYTSYEALLASYLDSSDIIAPAADILQKSSCHAFDGADIFVDCFNDFTSSQLRFLCNLIAKANNVTFGFSVDRGSSKDVFVTANSHITKLREKAIGEGIETHFVTDNLPERYERKDALFELSQKLFTGENSSMEIGGECELITAGNIYEEADFICAKIKQLVDENNMRYRDIAVLCTDLSSYGRYIESAFRKYDIPMFADMRESILYQPLVNVVISLLNALRGFSVDAVLSCIKTGFFSKFDKEKNERVGLSDYDVSVFEDYIFEWDLNTEHLKKPFTFGEDDNTRVSDAEEIRKSVAEPIWELSKKIPKGTIDGAQLTEMLYDFLVNVIDVKRVLFAKSVRSPESGLDGEKTALYQRLWDTLVKIFNALHKELSGYNTTLEEYYRLFRDVCAGTTLANPPQTLDSVLVGDIDRTRADNIKAAFIVGASYETFPTPAVQTGIFSQYETELIRESLAEIGGEFSLKSVREQYCLSLYRAYRAVCLPTEYLCISYSETDLSGDPVQISSVTEEIKGMFPNAEIKRAKDFDDAFYCRSVKAAKMRCAFGINSDSRENALLKKALIKNDCGDFVRNLEEIRTERSQSPESSAHSITAETAALLFPKQVGATAVEKLGLCRFSYFCEYGLGVSEKKQRAFNSARRGDAVHFVLERVLREIGGDIELLCSLTRAELYSLSRKYLDEYCRLETNNTFSDDARTRFLFNNIANSAADVLISMQAEFYSRSYRPKFFELDLKRGEELKFSVENAGKLISPPPAAELFSESPEKLPSITGIAIAGAERVIKTAPLAIKLDGDRNVYISGRIDRVDMFTVNENGEEKTYVRAVDYKSSVRGFDLYNALGGVNIQMLLYLAALLKANEHNPDVHFTAGGVCYIPSASSGASDREISPFKLLAMNHHESGLLVRDKATDEDLKNYTKFILERITAEDGKTELMNSDRNALSPEKRAEYDEYKKHLEGIEQSFLPDSLNSVSSEHFGELCDDLINNVGGKFSALFNGDVGALPISYYEKFTDISGKSSMKQKLPCDYCRFGDICKNAGKTVVQYDKKHDGWENKYLSETDKEE